jgi:hypothetical protein
MERSPVLDSGGEEEQSKAHVEAFFSRERKGEKQVGMSPRLKGGSGSWPHCSQMRPAATVAGEVMGCRRRSGRTGVARASALCEPLTTGPLRISNFN